jgi:hypothetical protein
VHRHLLVGANMYRCKDGKQMTVHDDPNISAVRLKRLGGKTSVVIMWTSRSCAWQRRTRGSACPAAAAAAWRPVARRCSLGPCQPGSNEESRPDARPPDALRPATQCADATEARLPPPPCPRAACSTTLQALQRIELVQVGRPLLRRWGALICAALAASREVDEAQPAKPSLRCPMAGTE